MNEEQVRSLLKFIDSSQTEIVKENIFSELCYDCFYSNNLDKWIDNFTDDVQAFLERINIEKKSKYWKILELNDEHTELKLIEKEVQECACAFADCQNLPMSLCYYCCKNFQQQLFGKLLNRQVEVIIDKSFLLGDKSCDTTIKII